jgi:acetyl-CoA carboxylase beta subunit
MLEHGLVDMVVPRTEIRKVLTQLIQYLAAEGAPPRTEPPPQTSPAVSGPSE